MKVIFYFLVITLGFLAPAGAQIDTAILRPVGYHPSDVTYFNTPYLSNSLAMGVYLCAGGPESLEIREIVSPITDIKVWLPPVDDPSTAGVNENLTGSLEGQFFHPLFLKRIADADWSFIRFMDWGKTNASPQQDWIDRRLPGHIFQAGILNSRQPSDTAEGNRETGVAWEHMVALSNATRRNLWINVPHLATADYITKLARLIRFGSDGVNPYTSTNPNPVFAPLDPDLKVYVEFSNEI